MPFPQKSHISGQLKRWKIHILSGPPLLYLLRTTQTGNLSLYSNSQSAEAAAEAERSRISSPILLAKGVLLDPAYIACRLQISPLSVRGSALT